MARPTNQCTNQIRQLVTHWLARTTLKEFTVIDITCDLSRQTESLKVVDLTKAVSNDLIRRQSSGMLSSRSGSADDMVLDKPVRAGRPARLYWRKWKNI